MGVLAMEPEVLVQRMTALQRANVVRLNGVAVKREVAAGALSVADALVDPRSRSLTVMALMRSQHRWGRTRVLRTLSPLMISENKRVSLLTERQRGMIAQACS